ncbi:methionyl-tRNA formyltransferase [Kytococcus schroeteri]|uniref:methionyl-tRNA formyltransferase n=1 Tax=Kytococcus schroeteri TaxID=138300 RepID=UPI001142D370|nr:methionyl-tRNA formyltransferase [Kytococcus schroeteri]
MRILFAGTPDVALPALDHLVAAGRAADGPDRPEVVGVLTRPDARVGRGRKVRPSPVKERATELGLPVLESDRPWEDDTLAALRELAPDVAGVVAYGALLPASVLQVPAHGWVNLHFSLLPAWRGAAPVQRALMAGDEITGATTFVLDEGMDTGPVLGTLTEAVRPTDTAGDLLDRLAHAGAPLLTQSLLGLVDGSLQPIAQPAEGVSRAPKLTVAEAELDFALPAFAVARTVAGCSPAPGAWTTFRGNRLKVLRAAAGPAVTDLAPGRITVREGAVLVGTAAGALRLVSVQPPGKQEMDADAWARGARFDDEEVLGG